jgi:hypothetical protein
MTSKNGNIFQRGTFMTRYQEKVQAQIEILDGLLKCATREGETAINASDLVAVAQEAIYLLKLERERLRQETHVTPLNLNRKQP